VRVGENASAKLPELGTSEASWLLASACDRSWALTEYVAIVPSWAVTVTPRLFQPVEMAEEPTI